MFNLKKRQEERDLKLRLQLEDQIVLAEQVRNFFATDVGKYLQQKMDEDKQSAKNQLMKVDPFDTKMIQKYQNDFTLINRITLYFGQALIAGTSAEKALNLQNYNSREGDYDEI
jgi:hypothetical protein